jgi:hypothetical protein
MGSIWRATGGRAVTPGTAPDDGAVPWAAAPTVAAARPTSPRHARAVILDLFWDVTWTFIDFDIAASGRWTPLGLKAANSVVAWYAIEHLLGDTMALSTVEMNRSLQLETKTRRTCGIRRAVLWFLWGPPLRLERAIDH